MTPVSVCEFANVLFPRGRKTPGVLIMLSGYFDDSGTHGDSAVVVMGGVIGDEDQWKTFERDWAARLLAPVETRGCISRFHMHDCELGHEEFEGWSKGERDRTIFNFRQIIIDSKLRAYVCAVARKPWDAYVRGNLRNITGDAERYGVVSCFVQSFKLAQENWPKENQIALAFDNRPHREEANRRVFELYNRHFQRHRKSPEPMGISFLSSEQALPLQAADMVAWESYRHAQEFLKHGRKAKPRPHFNRLVETGRVRAQIADAEVIRRLVKTIPVSQKRLQELGDFMAYGFPADPPKPSQ